MGLPKTTVNMQSLVTVGMWCNSDWPLDATATIAGTGNAKTGAGDTTDSGADCRINGTLYDASAPHARVQGQRRLPVSVRLRRRRGQFLPQRRAHHVVRQDQPQVAAAWPKSCVNNGTWSCTLGGTVIWPATQPQSCFFSSYKTTCTANGFSPAGCNTDPTYDLGGCTGSECKVCTNLGCTTSNTGQNGVCHLTATGTGGSGTASCNCTGPLGVCTLTCTTGAPNCVPAGSCAAYQPTPTGCTVGVLTQNQTCSQVASPACNAPLWDTAANVPVGTAPSTYPATYTMFFDSQNSGLVCRHNNKAYAIAPGTSVAINNFPTGVFNQPINSNSGSCGGVVPTTVTIPRHYWKTSVEWCTAKIVTAGDKWQGFGLPGTCQDALGRPSAHDATHIYPRFYKFGVDKTDPAYADNYLYANPAFERVTFDFTKIGSAPLG